MLHILYSHCQSDTDAKRAVVVHVKDRKFWPYDTAQFETRERRGMLEIRSGGVRAMEGLLPSKANRDERIHATGVRKDSTHRSPLAKGAAASTVDEIAVVILTPPLDGAVKPAAAEITAASGNRVSFIVAPGGISNGMNR